MNSQTIIVAIGEAVGLAGVIVIVGRIVAAGFLALRDARNAELSGQQRYSNARQRAGRGLVLGLEVLVAADIIQTVALEPAFADIGVLALIVLLRTFLGWSLTLELEGRWPWQREFHGATGGR